MSELLTSVYDKLEDHLDDLTAQLEAKKQDFEWMLSNIKDQLQKFDDENRVDEKFVR